MNGTKVSSATSFVMNMLRKSTAHQQPHQRQQPLRARQQRAAQAVEHALAPQPGHDRHQREQRGQRAQVQVRK